MGGTKQPPFWHCQCSYIVHRHIVRPLRSAVIGLAVPFQLSLGRLLVLLHILHILLHIAPERSLRWDAVVLQLLDYTFHATQYISHATRYCPHTYIPRPCARASASASGHCRSIPRLRPTARRSAGGAPRGTSTRPAAPRQRAPTSPAADRPAARQVDAAVHARRTRARAPHRDRTRRPRAEPTDSARERALGQRRSGGSAAAALLVNNYTPPHTSQIVTQSARQTIPNGILLAL
jgi:hypothetical protein